MTEIILGLLSLSLIGLNVYLTIKFHEKEKTYINAIMSKDVHEFTASEIAQKPIKPKEKLEEFVPMSEVDDEQFFKAIDKSVE